MSSWVKNGEERCSVMKINLFTSSEFPKTYAVINQALDRKLFPGVVIGLWQAQSPESVFLQAWGYRREVPSALPMFIDTSFDLASLTKVLATAALTARLVDRGWISWDTPVSSIFPEFLSREVRIRHLLSHTAGLAAWKPFWQDIRTQFSPTLLPQIPIEIRQAAMRQLILSQVPDHPVGSQAVYSDLSFLLLGFVLEEITQLPLDQAVARWIWKPMGVEGLSFHRVIGSAEDQRLSQVAATEACSWRGGVLQGQVHDDNCWAMGGYGGHAGVFGDAFSILQFVSQMWSGFFSQDTLSAFFTRVAQPKDSTRTLGWDTPSSQASSAGKYFSKYSVGHLGFTGTSLWIDLEAKLSITVLTNRVHPCRDRSELKVFRPLIHDALREDLVKRV